MKFEFYKNVVNLGKFILFLIVGIIGIILIDIIGTFLSILIGMIFSGVRSWGSNLSSGGIILLIFVFGSILAGSIELISRFYIFVIVLGVEYLINQLLKILPINLENIGKIIVAVLAILALVWSIYMQRFVSGAEYPISITIGNILIFVSTIYSLMNFKQSR